ncbi:MAG: hypothetical protein R3F59_24440 [Myxococcota bacterium]
MAGVDAHFGLHGRGEQLTVEGAELAGLVAQPGPVPVRVTGGVGYGPEGVSLRQVAVEAPGSRAVLDGQYGEHVALDLTLASLQGEALDPLTGGLGLRGSWQGRASARGDGAEVQLSAALEGGEAGGVSLTGQLDREASPVAWTAVASLDGWHLDALLATVTEPVVLGGSLTAWGSGTSLSSAAVDGRWRGGAQTLWGQPVDAVDAPFRLEGGVLSLADASLQGSSATCGSAGRSTSPAARSKSTSRAGSTRTGWRRWAATGCCATARSTRGSAATCAPRRPSSSTGWCGTRRSPTPAWPRSPRWTRRSRCRSTAAGSRARSTWSGAGSTPRAPPSRGSTPPGCACGSTAPT